MRVFFLLLIIVSVLISCSKDKIGLLDKKNDCKNLSLVGIPADQIPEPLENGLARTQTMR